MVFDYHSNADGVAYGQVRVNGSCGVLWDKAGNRASADGVRSPKNPTAGGSWFRLFAVPAAAKKLSALQTLGSTQLDDVVLTCHEPSVAPAFDMGTVTGVSYKGRKTSGWIPFATLDDVWGLPRDPSCDSDGDGFTNGEEILRGTDPLNRKSHPARPFSIILR